MTPEQEALFERLAIALERSNELAEQKIAVETRALEVAIRLERFTHRQQEG